MSLLAHSLPPHAVGDEEKPEYAYHFSGYPEFAKWMASSSGFFLLRRYSKLAARSLLDLQHELAKIEIRLTELDDLSVPKADGSPGIDSIEYDTPSEREHLIQKSTKLLQQYCIEISEL